MKHTYARQAKQFSIAFAAVAAFSALGVSTAQAAPTFTTADISINSVGFIDCSFKETGLAPGATVNYTCGATDVGWVTQCFVKNKPVANLPTRLHVAHAADGLITNRTYSATNRGVITQAILTAYPTAEAEVEEPLCPETEGVVITEEVAAIRWCNASLTDNSTPLAGASDSTLFLQMIRNGSSAVPECGVLATLPSDL
jgi:hypothetical protein